MICNPSQRRRVSLGGTLRAKRRLEQTTLYSQDYGAHFYDAAMSDHECGAAVFKIGCKILEAICHLVAYRAAAAPFRIALEYSAGDCGQGTSSSTSSPKEPNSSTC